MHQALYRKWRPNDFDSVVGQEHITSVLSYEVMNKKLSHAYLFCGSRGTGKTTCAKILAKAANCRYTVNGNPCNKCDSCRAIDSGSSVDVLEMDAASNTGVDYIRDIREEVMFAPGEMSYRVYIIDEVHMLSEGAFNALLKTLEEPPSNVIFILATTELQKIPATILSRCQRFDFCRIALSEIVNRLDFIAKEEGIELDGDAARLIARLSQGGMRDAISLLELCASGKNKVDSALVAEKAGVCGRETVMSLASMVAKRDYAGIFKEVSQIYNSSKDLAIFFSDMLSLYRDMMVIRAMHITDKTQIDPEILDVSDSEFASLSSLAANFKYPAMVYHTKLLKDAISAMRVQSDKRIIAEMTLVKMASRAQGDSNEALSARISELEDRLIKGAYSQNLSDPASTAAFNGAIGPQTDIEQTESGENDKNTDKINTAPSEEKTDDPSLTEYESWIETVSEYEKADAAGAPFLRNASAYTDSSGTLTIKTNDKFALSLLESSRADEKLIRAAAEAGDVFKRVVFVLSEEKKKEVDLLDEL